MQALPVVLGVSLTRALPAALFLLLAFAPPVQSQGILFWQFNGTAPGDWFGEAVVRLGDADGDGIVDLAVGAPQPGTGSTPPGPGYIRVFSGANAATLLSLGGPGPYLGYGGALAGAGDLDGDGSTDLLVGIPGLNQAVVYSVVTGAPLLTLSGTAPTDYFGADVAGPGDVDGDGVPDLLVGAPVIGFPASFVNPGSARLHSGSTGALLFTFPGPSPGTRFGSTVAGAGDTDGDGVPDLSAGTGPTITSSGQVGVFSGATGALLLTLPEPGSGTQFGRAIASAGDLDGDGSAELIVGAPRASPGGLFYAGTASVFSGATGLALFTFNGASALDTYGSAVGTGGDLNGDGVPDLLVGAESADEAMLANSGSGAVRVFSGSSGNPLYSFFGGPSAEAVGSAVTALGDLNGDGIAEFAFGAPLALFSAGQVRVYSVAGTPTGATTYGVGCPGSGGLFPQALTAGGPAAVGNAAFNVVVSGALGGSSAVLILGNSSSSWLGVPLPLNLGFLGLPCSLLASADVLLATTTSGSGPGTGIDFLPVPIPPNPALAGGTVYLQWYIVDPGPSLLPGSMSGGLSFVITP